MALYCIDDEKKGQRILAYYLHYTWNDLRRKVRELYPDQKDLVRGEDHEDLGRDLGNADGVIDRAEEILREVGRKGFSGLDGMLRDYVDSLIYLLEERDNSTGG